MHLCHGHLMLGGVVMRQTELHVTDEDRSVVDEIRCKACIRRERSIGGTFRASLGRGGLPEAQCMAVLGMWRTAVWRTRAAYLQGGVELVVFEVARPGATTPVRHGRRTAGDGAGLFGVNRRAAAPDDGGTRASGAPGAGSGQGESRNCAGHAHPSFQTLCGWYAGTHCALQPS